MIINPIKVEIKASKPRFFDNTYSTLICSTSTLNVTIILIKLVPQDSQDFIDNTQTHKCVT